MKLGQPPKKQWHSSHELDSKFNPLSNKLHKLMLLDYIWEQLVGSRKNFWVLQAVKKDTLYVQVKVSVAKNELVGKRRQLIRELNKHFDSPWIKHIEII
ncbi:MAG: DUF721 domain-containing protein [Elusimicrobiaceae bacterium]|nr:DUF721 domain-containing protein [Elusimicrobiaceae bacterium]